MIVFLAVFAAVCLYGIRLKPAAGEKYMTDYMSVDKTMAIKGIFIIIVFFSHFNSYVSYTWSIDTIYLKYFNMIGQCMVTLFMFYSGYGVMESIKKKKTAYIKKIPVTRVLGTLFRFDAAILLFVTLYLGLGWKVTVKQFLLSLIGWDAVGNSNWYIFAVLAAYIITYIAFIVFKDKGKYFFGVSAVTLGIALYIFILAYFKLKQSYWYDTIILYACGMWYSLLRDKIEKVINRNLIIYCVTFVTAAVGALYFMKNRSVSFIHTELCMILFTAAVVVFTMRISLNNAVLRWCGKHLFGLYILQRLPMIALREIGVSVYNIYLYFILCFILTVFGAWVFEFVMDKVWRMIINPKKKTA